MPAATTPQRDLHEVASKFAIDGEFCEAAPYGHGHINETYCATFKRAGGPVCYILQRINHNIFRDPAGLMENIERVSEHLKAQLTGHPDKERRALSLIRDRNGCAMHVDADGGYWRAYGFIEDARTCDAVETAQQAFEGGRAFGRFIGMLADLPAPRLHDTIPGFHNGPKRFSALEEAIARDAVGRVREAEPEIAFIRAHEAVTRSLLDSGLPERVTHNDTKINNVMIDNATGEGICVIDLDTVMPGLAAYDFGDLVRTATCLAQEDERDLSKVGVSVELFEALARGFVGGAGSLLMRDEKESLVMGGKLITLLIGIRFLTDYLNGDAYFKVHRPGQNLDRCRVQLKLVESIEGQQSAMERFVRELS